MKKQAVILSGALLAVLLLFREFGIVDFSLCRSRTHTGATRVSQGSPEGLPLTKDEEERKMNWKSAELSRNRVYYSETCVRPWTRWIPLIKTGKTQILREYFVTSDKGKILWGKDDAVVSLTVFGSMAARKYSESVEEKERRAFLRWIEGKIAKNSRRPAR